MIRHFIDLWDITVEEGWLVLNDSLKIKEGAPQEKILEGKYFALIFTKPSTRTRVSFEISIRKLGGGVMFLQENNLQLVRGEEIKDTARTLSRYLDGVVIRTDSHEKLKEFASYSSIPVINALTDMSHPCQVLSDVLTLYERFGKGIKDLKIAYVGDGNNVCNTWLVAAGLFGLKLFVSTPEGYEPSSYYYQAGEDLCKITGGSIYLTPNPVEAVKDADVVYTDVWVSMNQNRDEEKLQALKNYQVNSELLKHAKNTVLVMHCLPAKKGEEITEDVFEKFADFIFTQAENRVYAQMGLLKLLFTQQEAVLKNPSPGRPSNL